MISRRRFITGALGGGAALVAQGCQQMAAPPRSKRLIVDSQVHLWQAETPEWRWVPGIVPHLRSGRSGSVPAWPGAPASA